MNYKLIIRRAVAVFALCLPLSSFAQGVTRYVNPFLGTATLWLPEDLGYTHTETKRAWGAEVSPGSTLPNAMVQVAPVTMYHSGAGYQYEDREMYGFAHTCKGHWNLLHLPVLPVTGYFYPRNYASHFSHSREEAHPGYYSVFLERYGVTAELTSTLRCAFHRYSFRPADEKQLLVDISRNNGRPRRYEIHQEDTRSFAGFQDGEGRIYFYAVTNYDISGVEMVQDQSHKVAIVDFRDSRGERPLEVRFGFSFVSIEGAKANLEAEMLTQSFDEVRLAADNTWEKLIGRVQVSGGTERQRGLFYSCLYRTFMWPALRSDVNGDFIDERGQRVNLGFRYYTNPSFWDTYRNKLVLLAMLSPDVACDIIRSITDRGEKRGGYMPTFFHGDHASAFVAGTWLRGVRDFDLQRAYDLLLRNATVPGRGGRPFLDEYIAQGWIAEKDTTNVPTGDEYKAAVTKTVEYAYDDYATALIAHELKDRKNEKLLRKRSMNYKNLFDPSTGFWRGRIADGSWITPFDPYYPYYAYQYREANGWQSLFFAPHDPEGMVALYPNAQAVELKLDSLFSEPWRAYEAWNFTGFLGNYCHGNQPDHSVPYTYYFIDRQPKAQAILNTLMEKYYDMGEDHLAYAGMDDAGEMSAWYVFNALGIYTYSPADPRYIVTVPLFPEVHLTVQDHDIAIRRQGEGLRITSIQSGGKPVDGWFIDHSRLLDGGLTVVVE
ncbi:MAG: GH92 family glycosyl hydrolase [Bacteroidaceae bacterium]|nr:GH92 family glycosyl hydrolase [Bacteroidaceae bacterium]